MNHQTISVTELRAMMTEAAERFVLIDVRSEAEHQAAHIPGAKPNCVFEIAFSDRMGGIAAPGDKRIVCVHGNAETTYEARMAAEKLVRAGYPEVLEFRGGIEEWWRRAGPSRVRRLHPPPIPA